MAVLVTFHPEEEVLEVSVEVALVEEEQEEAGKSFIHVRCIRI